jgi:hypothetical protein
MLHRLQSGRVIEIGFRLAASHQQLCTVGGDSEFKTGDNAFLFPGLQRIDQRAIL